MVSIMMNKTETHCFEIEVHQLSNWMQLTGCGRCFEIKQSIRYEAEVSDFWIGIRTMSIRSLICGWHQHKSKVLNRCSQASTALFIHPKRDCLAETHAAQMVRYSENVNSKVAMHNKTHRLANLIVSLFLRSNKLFNRWIYVVLSL